MTYYKDTKLKKFNVLKTDFYQLTGVLAFILSNKANDISGYEAFVRNIKDEINPNKNHYIFSGEKLVRDFMSDLSAELVDPKFVETFSFIILSKIKDSTRKAIYKEKIESFFMTANCNFEYDVAKEGALIHPLIPAFQIRGPRWICQLIETIILNLINGKTGLLTFKTYGNNKDIELFNYLSNIVNSKPNIKDEFKYKVSLVNRSKEYRKSFNGLLFEGAARRAPSYLASLYATKIALDNNWDASSNLGAWFDLDIPLEKIGGTMMHAFILAFDNELEAYQVWYDLFPDFTILIDTYDSINAIKLLIDNNIKPESVRIDSSPLDKLTLRVREILDDNKWFDVKIYISGDLTPTIFNDYKKSNIPFDKAMVGTKYINENYFKYTNAGFVYKIVEYISDSKYFFPEKKALGKMNYPGLKSLKLNSDNELLAYYKTQGKFDIDLSLLSIINSQTKIIFESKE